MDQLFDTHKASKKLGRENQDPQNRKKFASTIGKGNVMSCICRHVYVSRVYIYIHDVVI